MEPDELRRRVQAYLPHYSSDENISSSTNNGLSILAEAASRRNRLPIGGAVSTITLHDRGDRRRRLWERVVENDLVSYFRHHRTTPDIHGVPSRVTDLQMITILFEYNLLRGEQQLVSPQDARVNVSFDVSDWNLSRAELLTLLANYYSRNAYRHLVGTPNTKLIMTINQTNHKTITPRFLASLSHVGWNPSRSDGTFGDRDNDYLEFLASEEDPTSRGERAITNLQFILTRVQPNINSVNRLHDYLQNSLFVSQNPLGLPDFNFSPTGSTEFTSDDDDEGGSIGGGGESDDEPPPPSPPRRRRTTRAERLQHIHDNNLWQFYGARNTPRATRNPNPRNRGRAGGSGVVRLLQQAPRHPVYNTYHYHIMHPSSVRQSPLRHIRPSPQTGFLPFKVRKEIINWESDQREVLVSARNPHLRHLQETWERYVPHESRDIECVGNCFQILEKEGRVPEGTYKKYLEFRLANGVRDITELHTFNFRQKDFRPLALVLRVNILLWVHDSTQPRILYPAIAGKENKAACEELPVVELCSMFQHCFLYERVDYTAWSIAEDGGFSSKHFPWVNHKTHPLRHYSYQEARNRYVVDARMRGMLSHRFVAELIFRGHHLIEQLDEREMMEPIALKNRRPLINCLEHDLSQGFMEPLDWIVEPHERRQPIDPFDISVKRFQKGARQHRSVDEYSKYTTIIADFETWNNRQNMNDPARATIRLEGDVMMTLCEGVFRSYRQVLVPEEQTPSNMIAPAQQFMNALMSQEYGGGQRFMIVFHNLGFDINLVVDQVPQLQILSRLASSRAKVKVFMARYHDKILYFKDSLSMIPFPLSAFNRVFGLEEDEAKGDCPHNYYNETTIREPFAKIEEAAKFSKLSLEDFTADIEEYRVSPTEYDHHAHRMLKYGRKDVEVLEKGYNIMREWVRQYFDESLDHCVSIPNVAFNYFYNNNAFYGVSPVSGVALEYAQRHVVGGRCMTASFQKIQVLPMPHVPVYATKDFCEQSSDIYNAIAARVNNNEMSYYDEATNVLTVFRLPWQLVVVQDFNSLYPYAMQREDLPIPLGKGIKLSAEQCANFHIEDYQDFLITIRVSKVLRTRAFPLLRTVRRGHTNVITEDDCEVECSKVYLQDLMRWQPVEYTVVGGYYFDEVRYGGELRRVVQELYQLRLQLKNEGKLAEQIVKLIMNSSYGRLIKKMERFTEKWMNLTPEDLEKIRSEVTERVREAMSSFNIPEEDQPPAVGTARQDVDTLDAQEELLDEDNDSDASEKRKQKKKKKKTSKRKSFVDVEASDEDDSDDSEHYRSDEDSEGSLVDFVARDEEEDDDDDNQRDSEQEQDAHRAFDNDWENDLDFDAVVRHYEQLAERENIGGVGSRKKQKKKKTTQETVHEENSLDALFSEVVDPLIHESAEMEFASPNESLSAGEDDVMRLLDEIDEAQIAQSVDQYLRDCETDRKLMFEFRPFVDYVTRHYNYIVECATFRNKALIKKMKSGGRPHYNMATLATNILDISKRRCNEVMCLAEDEGLIQFYQDTDSMSMFDTDLAHLDRAYQRVYPDHPPLFSKELGALSNDFDAKVGARNDNYVRGVHSDEGGATEALYAGKKSYFADVLYVSRDESIAPHVSVEVKKLKGIRGASIRDRCQRDKCTTSELYYALVHGEARNFDMLAENSISLDFLPSFVITKKENFWRKVVFDGGRTNGNDYTSHENDDPRAEVLTFLQEDEEEESDAHRTERLFWEEYLLELQN